MDRIRTALELYRELKGASAAEATPKRSAGEQAVPPPLPIREPGH